METTNKQQAAAGYTEGRPQAYEAVLNGNPVHLYTLTNKQGPVKFPTLAPVWCRCWCRTGERSLDDVTLVMTPWTKPGPTSCPAVPPSAAMPTVSTKVSSPWTGKNYHLSLNNVTNSLHGGHGSRTQVFDAKQIDAATLEPGSRSLRTVRTAIRATGLLITATS